MSISNVRVPPDSTGKRIVQRPTLELGYQSGTVDFEIGDLVVGLVSGITGKVVKVVGSTSTGTIHLTLEQSSPEAASASEQLQVLGSTRALASSAGTPYYAQGVVLLSADNHQRGQRVNSYGAGLVSFAEGQPTLDALGQLRTANCVVLGAYDFVAGSQLSLFWDEEVGSGTVTHDIEKSLMVLSVGTTTGHAASRITNRYHYYQPGTGNLAMMTIALGDTGKTNNVREWGLFDSRNGIFFDLRGTSLGVVVRTDTSGAVVEERATQSFWNVDRVDGTGTSGYIIDVSKRNLYWMDYLWLGAGSVRFGVFGDQGERIVCHEMVNTNEDPVPFMGLPSLPISCRNYNTGSTASTTEIRYITSSVYSESATDYVFWRYSDMESPSLKAITTDTPLLAVRPQLEVEGRVNRVGTYPDTLAMFVTGGPVKMDYHYGVDSLVGATWGVVGVSTLQGDSAATSFTTSSGTKMFTQYLPAGTTNVDLKQWWETNDIGICLSADGVTQPIHVISLTKLNPGDTVTAAGTLTYRELS